MKAILIVGGTGAQGAAVVRALAASPEYRVLLFTRDMQSPQSQSLLSLANVEAVINSAAQGYDLAAFEAAARRSYGVFINTDGFALGEKAETYWGIRLYETAVQARVKHVVYSGLDDCFRDSDSNPEYYVGHFQGKARVQAYIQGQPRSRTAWTITRSGPYIEMLSEALLPQVNQDGSYVFRYPLDDGAAVFIHLDDYGRYVKWAFDNPVDSVGLDLGIGIAHTRGEEIAAAFTAVTKKPARFENIPASAWCDVAFSRFPNGANTKVGYRSVQDQSELGMTYRENFTGFWNLWKASGGNVGLVKRDYKLLDEILPDRVRSVQDWMERTRYTGARSRLLKEF